MARQRQLRICREGWYYLLVVLAVLIGGTLRQLNLLMLLGCVLAGPLVFSLCYGRFALRRFKVERILPTQLHAGARLSVDVSVSNLRRWLNLWTLEVGDTLEHETTAADREPAQSVGVFFPVIAGRETRLVTYHGFLPQRGRYRFGPLKVSTRFPLGLVRHSLRLDQTETLLVQPKFGRLSHEWAQVVREDSAGSQRMHRRGLLEADFYGLRDWRAGDSRRWIHWRTSARRGSLVVRQFEQRRRQDLALLVDLWQPPGASEEQWDHVERTISFVATVIAEACRQPGHHLVLSLAAAEPLHRSGPVTPLFFQEQMEALALARAHSEAAFPRSLGHALSLVPPSMPTLLISTRAIDWDIFQAAAAENNVQLAGRKLTTVNAAGPELARYYHD